MKVSPIVARSRTASAWLRCCCAASAPEDMMPWTVPAGRVEGHHLRAAGVEEQAHIRRGVDLTRSNQPERVLQVLGVLDDADHSQHPPVHRP